jgi:hypothetical protein
MNYAMFLACMKYLLAAFTANKGGGRPVAQEGEDE